MGILDFLRDRRGNRVEVNVAVPTVKSILGMQPEDVYRSQPALRAVVSFLARNIAQLPLKCYIRDGDNDRVRDTESSVALLLASPNPRMTTYEVVEMLVMDLKLRGWALWYICESAETASGWAIEPIPASWVVKTPTLDGFEPFEYRVRNPDTTGATVTLPASDCIRFYNANPGHPLLPTSPVDALKDVLAEQVSAWSFRNQIWKNGGRIQGYIYRPPQVQWSQGAFDRFKKEWQENYSGNDGAKAGGTPIFEDGMEFRTVPFNARETEWSQATVLSRQDVAGVYHVNPALVWSNDGQTYASVKDNARSLYVETLGPDLRMIPDRINQFLYAKVGGPENGYCEFDIQAKLAGSFEEQAQQLQTAVGAPYMLRSEARARMNLPYIDGTDDLVTPLNVLVGGQASPTDTDTSMLAAPWPASALMAAQAIFGQQQRRESPRKSQGKPSGRDSMEMAAALRRHFKRQRKNVLSVIDRDRDKGGARVLKANGDPPWWDSERWDEELTADLYPIFLRQATASGKRAMGDIGHAGGDYDEGRTEEYIAVMCRKRAEAVNAVTLRQLRQALDGDVEDDDALGATPEGVFDKAEDTRADTSGVSFATAVAAWAVMEACRQSGERNVTKTWVVTSGNPRASHAAMDGETVPYGEPFSNGAQWPGDTAFLDADETCGCQCDVIVTVS